MNDDYWAVRLVRPGGRIKFRGNWYKITSSEYANGQKDPPYDGRLDGKKMIFYQYNLETFPHLADSVWLYSAYEETWPGPACINGVFVWTRWIKE